MAENNFCSAELIDRKDVTARLAVFRFAVPEPVQFKAGQYTTLGIRCDDDLVERPYSIVSSPSEECLEFFVELVPSGIFTPRLWSMKAGDRIQVRRRVVGQFILDHEVKLHLMLATVTGVAPFISMLRTHDCRKDFVDGESDQFLLIHGASRSSDFGPYRDELEELATKGWLVYVPTISRPWDEPNWQGEIGRVEDIVRKYADHQGFLDSNATAYACGHPQMVANIRDILIRALFPEQHIRQENYFAAHSYNALEERPNAVARQATLTSFR